MSLLDAGVLLLMIWVTTKLAIIAMLPKPSGEILNHQSAFGYLWWLNGKESLIPAGITIPMEASLASNAPEDLIAGMDKNGQYLDVIPSRNLVIIRMGEAPDGNNLAPINFHNEMWSNLKNVLF